MNWLNGVMGVANAERSLDYIRAIAEFISQVSISFMNLRSSSLNCVFKPQYKDLIPVFGILNEPFSPTVGKAQLRSLQVFSSVRYFRFDAHDRPFIPATHVPTKCSATSPGSEQETDPSSLFTMASAVPLTGPVSCLALTD